MSQQASQPSHAYDSDANIDGRTDDEQEHQEPPASKEQQRVSDYVYNCLVFSSRPSCVCQGAGLHSAPILTSLTAKQSSLLDSTAARAADQQDTVLQNQDSLHSGLDWQLSWVHMEWTCATDVHDILYTGMQHVCCPHHACVFEAHSNKLCLVPCSLQWCASCSALPRRRSKSTQY